VIALAAFGFGAYVATASQRARHRLVLDYVTAWAHDQYPRMYAMLDGPSRARMTEAQFAADYRAAAQVATLVSLRVIHVGSARGSQISVSMRTRTRIFGRLRELLVVPLSAGPSVHFSGTLLFPGLRPGERLHRLASLAPRAALLARNGTPLAEGPDRTSPIPEIASGIVGVLGPIPADERSTYAMAGYPASAKVGIDGLERIFQTQLAGRPGGTLLAGNRVLARAAPLAGRAVTTTIDPAIEQAAIDALGSSYGGIAAMDPRTGQLLALVGIAFSDIQPPGSTMKIITSTAALQAGIVKLGDVFPIATSATIDGYTLQNANGEACGGTLLNAFAVSCNSVFAPLGARLGGARLVAMAQRFGFDQQPSIPGATESIIPSASQIGDSLAVGSSAIGQGMVEASPLEMTDVAATIAMGGRRPLPTLDTSQPPRFVPVTTSHVAGEVQQMMVAVVEFGTGTAAEIPGVTVAGKTGTAELVNTANPNTPNASSPKNTDAWFVGYAPVGAPKIVVGALFPNAGAGGGTAAPPVREVLLAGLHLS
jgi:penicillin-binding protein A